MRIPPYWARATYTGRDPKGRESTFAATGWSFQSPDEARSEAERRAKRIFDIIESGQPAKQYEYADRPLREEILDRIDVGGRDPVLLTRNRYGAVILNTTLALFADLDQPQGLFGGGGGAGGGGMLRALFGGKRKQPAPDRWEPMVQRAAEWAARNPEHEFRLYKTHSGLRLLFTSKTYEPKSQETASILRELGSDPMYQRLTDKQECFRARLTPKPWRCHFHTPPHSFPWEDPSQERAQREWEQKYQGQCERHVVCVLDERYAAPARDPIVQQIVDIHDRWTCAPADLPLA